MATLSIGSGFYLSDSLPISAQQAVNWRPSVPQTQTITQDNLFNTEGIEELANTGGAPFSVATRGSHTFAGKAYFVIGEKLYRLNFVNDNYSLTELGEILGFSRVFMSNNGLQMCITAPPDSETPGRSYIFTEDPDTLTEITDANFDGPASASFYSKGYFVFIKADGKKFFNSPLNNGLGPYDPLDFSTAEADPDPIRAGISLRDQVYILGSETTQIFRDIGRAPAPLAPISGAVIDVGISVPQSLVLFAGGIAFIGAGRNESPAVWYVSGGQKQKISTIAIENELSKLAISVDPKDVFAWVYSDSGAYFLGISLISTCFVYDSINQRWHERKSFERNELGRYRVGSVTTAYGRVLLGDLQDGRIGAFNKSLYTEYNQIVRRFVRGRPFDNEGKPVYVGPIEAVIEAGVGLNEDVELETGEKTSLNVPLTATGGSDPKITMSYSDDGGRRFKSFRSRSMGKIGEHKKRAIWRKGNGWFPRSRVLQFEVASPTKATLIKVEADISG